MPLLTENQWIKISLRLGITLICLSPLTAIAEYEKRYGPIQGENQTDRSDPAWIPVFNPGQRVYFDPRIGRTKMDVDFLESRLNEFESINGVPVYVVISLGERYQDEDASSVFTQWSQSAGFERDRSIVLHWLIYTNESEESSVSGYAGKDLGFTQNSLRLLAIKPAVKQQQTEQPSEAAILDIVRRANDRISNVKTTKRKTTETYNKATPFDVGIVTVIVIGPFFFFVCLWGRMIFTLYRRSQPSDPGYKTSVSDLKEEATFITGSVYNMKTKEEATFVTGSIYNIKTKVKVLSRNFEHNLDIANQNYILISDDYSFFLAGGANQDSSSVINFARLSVLLEAANDRLKAIKTLNPEEDFIQILSLLENEPIVLQGSSSLNLNRQRTYSLFEKYSKEETITPTAIMKEMDKAYASARKALDTLQENPE